MRRFHTLLVLASLAASVCCCSIDDRVYTPDDIDMELNLFCNGLTVPLGSAGPYVVDSLLNLTKYSKFASYLKTNEQGYYYFDYKDTLQTGFKAPDSQGQKLPDVEFGKCLSLGKIPGPLKNVELDVDPELTMVFRTNVDVPSVGELTLTPYPHKERAVCIKDIELPVSDSPSETVSGTICLQDISCLFKTLPDSLTATMKIRACDGEHFLTPGASYSIKAECSMDLPLILGKAIHIDLDPSIVDINVDLRDVLANNPVGLEAEVQSSLPLGINMKFSFLDNEGRTVEMKSECAIIIPAAGTGPEPERTHVRAVISLKEGVAQPAKLRVDYGLDAKDNVWLNKTQRISLSEMKFLLPEGLTLK